MSSPTHPNGASQHYFQSARPTRQTDSFALPNDVGYNALLGNGLSRTQFGGDDTPPSNFPDGDDYSIPSSAISVSTPSGYKLFIGQIPKDLIEEDIFPVFSSFGSILELQITREPLTSIKSIKYNNKLSLANQLSGEKNERDQGYQQLSRGYGFVTYMNREDSLRCKEALNNKYVFPSSTVCYSPSGQPTQRKPVQIREAIENYAEMVAEKREEAKKKKKVEESLDAETKLFVGMISKNVDEYGVRELFSNFGEIKEVFILRDKKGG